MPLSQNLSRAISLQWHTANAQRCIVLQVFVCEQFLGMYKHHDCQRSFAYHSGVCVSDTPVHNYQVFPLQGDILLTWQLLWGLSNLCITHFSCSQTCQQCNSWLGASMGATALRCTCHGLFVPEPSRWCGLCEGSRSIVLFQDSGGACGGRHSRRPASGGHHLPSPWHPQDGEEERHRAQLAFSRNPRLHDSHLQ